MRYGIYRKWIYTVCLWVSCLGTLDAQVAPESLDMQAVSDYSELLSPEEEGRLSKRMISYYDSTSVQIAIATIPAAYLGEYTAEMYANTLARHWGLGTEKDNSGLLILVVGKPDESKRTLRFEVGYGLEPVLTDVSCFRIQQGVMVPQLKQRNYYRALRNGLDAIEETIKFGELPFYLQPPPEKKRLSSWEGIANTYILWGCFLFGVAFITWLASVLERRFKLKKLREELELKENAGFSEVYEAVVSRLSQGQNVSRDEDILLHAFLQKAYHKGFKQDHTGMYVPYKKGKSLQQRGIGLLNGLPRQVWRHWQSLLLMYVGMGTIMWGAIQAPSGSTQFSILTLFPVLIIVTASIYLVFVMVRANRTNGSGGSTGGGTTYSSSGSNYGSSSYSDSSSYDSGGSYDSGSSYDGGGGDFGGGGASSDW